MIRGEPPQSDDEDGSSPAEEKKPSLTAIPKTKPKAKPKPPSDGDLEPEPSV